MSQHMLLHLQALAAGRNAGWHYGTLNALVKRGFAETFRGTYGTEYRITAAGLAQLEESK